MQPFFRLVRNGNVKKWKQKSKTKKFQHRFKVLASEKWKTKVKIRISFFEVVGKRKSKIEVRIPFSEVVGKRKSKIEVRIPFSEVVRKRKTNIEVRFSFTCVVGKRLALGYTHLIQLFSSVSVNSGF